MDGYSIEVPILFPGIFFRSSDQPISHCCCQSLFESRTRLAMHLSPFSLYVSGLSSCNIILTVDASPDSTNRTKREYQEHAGRGMKRAEMAHLSKRVLGTVVSRRTPQCANLVFQFTLRMPAGISPRVSGIGRSERNLYRKSGIWLLL